MDCSRDLVQAYQHSFGRPNSGRPSEFLHKLYFCDLNMHTTYRPFIPCSKSVTMSCKADQGNEKAVRSFQPRSQSVLLLLASTHDALQILLSYHLLSSQGPIFRLPKNLVTPHQQLYLNTFRLLSRSCFLCSSHSQRGLTIPSRRSRVRQLYQQTAHRGMTLQVVY